MYAVANARWRGPQSHSQEGTGHEVGREQVNKHPSCCSTRHKPVVHPLGPHRTSTRSSSLVAASPPKDWQGAWSPSSANGKGACSIAQRPCNCPQLGFLRLSIG